MIPAQHQEEDRLHAALRRAEADLKEAVACMREALKAEASCCECGSTMRILEKFLARVSRAAGMDGRENG